MFQQYSWRQFSFVCCRGGEGGIQDTFLIYDLPSPKKAVMSRTLLEVFVGSVLYIYTRVFV